MINVESVSCEKTSRDKFFSLGVAVAQATVVRVADKLRAYKRTRQGLIVNRQPTASFTEDLRRLGLIPERLWWGAMTLFPENAQFLIREIERRPPTCVLEVGAGTTTPIFAALGNKYGFNVLSLENHQGTIDYVRAALDGLPFADRVTIQKCGFVRRRYPNGEGYWWYDADLSRAGSLIDFVFVDGPMSHLVGRNGALPEVASFLAPFHRIYLDDIKRRHEAQCLVEWAKHFPGLIVDVSEESPRIARIRVPSTGITGASARVHDHQAADSTRYSAT